MLGSYNIESLVAKAKALAKDDGHVEVEHVMLELALPRQVAELIVGLCRPKAIG